MQTKNCELDKITTKILKSVLPSVLQSLTHIINLSLDQGKFDKEWATAVVRPLQKKQGNNTNETNYRPISNLSFISKIAEKAMLRQLLNHTQSNNLIPEYQSAYRPFHSCETNLFRLVNDILIGMENQKITALAVMDLSAAFNTVPHDRLLKVLNCKFRTEETALQWIENYLRPQFFKVSINKEYSDTKELTCSVPQGSAAGTNLFTCYASTLEEVLTDNTELELNGFADDHSVWKSFDAKSRMEEYTMIATTDRSMLKIKKWMDAVRLKMNESKTEFMLLGSRQHQKKCTTNSLKVLGENTEKFEVIRYLGRYLNSTLMFKQHIKTKCKSAMLNLLKIINIRKYLDRDTTTQLTVSLCLADLDYANNLLISLPDGSIKLRQKVLNMAAKVVLNLKKHDSSTQPLRTLHWLPIRQ